jgi:trk system potassium uptake protein
LVIEKDPMKADRIVTNLGGIALQGDGAEVATMEQAGLDRADVVAAVTGDDEDNLVVCQVAKLKFNVPRTVARINNPRNEFVFSKLGIDATVSATQIILSVIQQEIPEHPFVHLLTIQEGGIEFVELQLTDDSPVVGGSLSQIALPEDTAVPLLLRGGRAQILGSDTELQAGDKLIALTTVPREGLLRTLVLGDRP